MSALPKRETFGRDGVVVAYDGSPEASRGLIYAANIVGRGGRVTVVNVIPVQSVSARLQTVSDDQRQAQRNLLADARSLLEARGVEATIVGTAGDPVVEILAAREAAGAGALVVGRSPRRRALHMRVGDQLVRRAPCDVLVVH